MSDFRYFEAGYINITKQRYFKYKLSTFVVQGKST